MKINRKGFTLIELLAVVVILLAISMIAISSISAAIERNKAKHNNTKKEIIVSYAKLYYEEHQNSLPESGCILIEDLNLTENEITDVDGNVFEGGVQYTEGSDFTFVSECNQTLNVIPRDLYEK